MYGGLIVILCPVFYLISVWRHTEDSTGSWNSSCTISTCVFESLLPYSPNTLLAWRISTSAITHRDHFSDGEGKQMLSQDFRKVITLLSKRNVLMCMVTPLLTIQVCVFKLTSEDKEDVLYRVELILLSSTWRTKWKKETVNKVNQLHISGVLNAIFFHVLKREIWK